MKFKNNDFQAAQRKAGRKANFFRWGCVGFSGASVILLLPLVITQALICYLLLGLCLIAAWCMGVIYFMHHHSYFKTQKWLAECGYEDLAEEIRPDKYGLTFGKQAVISLKPYLVIPYEMIGMVNLSHDFDEDGDIIRSHVHIRCTDGTRFTREGDSEDVKNIFNHAPHTINGNESGSKRAFYKKYPQVRRKRQRLWGFVLAIIAAAFCILTITVGKLNAFGIALIALPALAGAFLLLKTRKAPKSEAADPE